jgi:uncharacterized protein YcbX
MRVGTILQLWRSPVKSMGGERLTSAVLTQRGIPGDRGWAVYDESRHGVTTAKRLPSLRLCRVRYPHEPVAGAASPPAEITLPDGTCVLTGTDDAARFLGELIGRPVSLRALGPVGSEAAPRVSSAGESPESMRNLMGIQPGEPMPDLSAFPPERLQALRQGNFFDALPLHFLSRTTLKTLARLAPESDWDERRFRPNLFIEADDPEGYPELGWIGRQLRVGTALIEVVAGCPRCAMVTQPFDDVPQDQRIMRTLVRETKHTAGIYARVLEEGEAKVEDPVELLG